MLFKVKFAVLYSNKFAESELIKALQLVEKLPDCVLTDETYNDEISKISVEKLLYPMLNEAYKLEYSALHDWYKLLEIVLIPELKEKDVYALYDEKLVDVINMDE